jgi:hypothetical protein
VVIKETNIQSKLAADIPLQAKEGQAQAKLEPR